VAKIPHKELFVKKGILGLVCAVILAGGVFAQENNSGHIKPTLGVGFIIGEFSGQSETLTGLNLDVDFVNSFGLTFGLQNTMAWNNDMADVYNFFGFGYTYVAPQWSAGAKIMYTAMLNTGAVGLDANGTWWFMEKMGLTATMNYFFSIGDIDWNFFGIRVGVSTRF